MPNAILRIVGVRFVHRLFEAADAATVEALNDAAKIPYNRVAPALDLQP